jgi:hypothetical protein
MGVWSAIRGMWSRHDERAAKHELDKESAEFELPGIVEQPASARAGGVIPNPAAQPGEAEAEDDRPSVEFE